MASVILAIAVSVVTGQAWGRGGRTSSHQRRGWSWSQCLKSGVWFAWGVTWALTVTNMPLSSSAPLVSGSLSRSPGECPETLLSWGLGLHCSADCHLLRPQGTLGCGAGPVPGSPHTFLSWCFFRVPPFFTVSG